MVRTNFLGFAILALLLPVYFVACIAFQTIPYLIGVLGPCTLLAISCFLNKSHMIKSHDQILPEKWAWVCVVAFLCLGGALHLLKGFDFGVSWYISAGVFFLLTTAGQLILALFGVRSYSNENDVIR